MYPALLGRFAVPPKGHWTATPNWVTEVQYIPEAPIVVRGTMNPWAQERQREVFLAEEQTWTKIQKQQKEYRRILRAIDAAIVEFNAKLRELENVTGKKAPLADITTYASLLYSLSGGPYGFVVAIAKIGFDFLMSQKKKKKIKKIIGELEAIQARLTAMTAQLDGIQKKVHDLIQTGDRIRDTQAVRISQDWQKSEGLYEKRVALDRQRADVLRERNRQVALWQPRPTGESYAL